MSLDFEVGRIHLQLPSGSAAIQGFVRGTDGTPVLGAADSGRPVWMGGSWRLFEGLPPLRRRHRPSTVVDLRDEWRRFDLYGFDWAGVTTSDVSAKAQRLGWHIITRRQAAALLVELGYYIPPRYDVDDQPFLRAVLWDDQRDDLTWHVREAIDGFKFTYERCAFVSRTPEPLTTEPALPSAS